MSVRICARPLERWNDVTDYVKPEWRSTGCLQFVW